MKTLGQIIPAALILRSKLPLETPINDICNDSRLIKPGDAFFAVTKKDHDRSHFIDSAIARGATMLIVDTEDLFVQFANTVLVPSTRSALAHAACAWHNHPTRNLCLVGVTGTNGKTTTTFLLQSIFDHLNLPAGLIGTVEYRLGIESREATLTTPGAIQLQALFAEMRDQGISHGSMEVSSIALDQCRSDGTHFSTVLFTNLTQDHLDYHGSFEEYYRSKQRLFTDYDAKTAVINIDDPWGSRLKGELTSSVRLISFGMLGDADIKPISAQFNLSGIRASISALGHTYDLESPLIGQHNLMNCLGAIGAAVSLDIPMPAVLAALKIATGAPGRLERVCGNSNRPSVFVDYAHTPDALENVLLALRGIRSHSPSTGRIITVFGCGGDRDRTKRPIMGKAASHLSDITVATSDNPRTEDPEIILDEIEGGMSIQPGRHYRNSKRTEAIRLALSLAAPNDIVLVAGKGHETYQIIGKQKLPFDDRQAIRDYYDSLCSAPSHFEP